MIWDSEPGRRKRSQTCGAAQVAETRGSDLPSIQRKNRQEAQVHKFPTLQSKSQTMALLGVLMVAGATFPAWSQDTPPAAAAAPAAGAPKERKVKDVAEYDI